MRRSLICIINSLENISTGPSSIPLKLLSLIPDLIIIPLAFIIYMSLQTGVSPDLLKLVSGYSYTQGWINTRHQQLSTNFIIIYF